MKYDVVVVGAGPAGSTAAKCLAEKGLKVLLIDRNTFPRDKPCGGGLTTRVLKQFPYVIDLLDSISYGSITYTTSLEKKLKLIRDKPLIATVLRDKFDHGLVKIAIKKGATFQTEKKAVDIKISKNGVKVILDNGKEIESELVVGCDGINSVIAKKANLYNKKSNTCLSIYQESPMSATQIDKYFTKKRMIYIFVKAQRISGYGWIFPKKKYVNVGIGEFEPAVDKSKPKKNLKETYENYINILKEKKILPYDFKIENLKGGTLPVFPLEKTYTDRVILCGDSAGFINPITGEGIYYAMVSGEIAAKVITEALGCKDTSEDFLSKYQKIWKKAFGKDLEELGHFNKRWGMESEKIVKLIMRDKTFFKMVVGVMGGQISFSRYKPLLILTYLYAIFKNYLIETLNKTVKLS